MKLEYFEAPGGNFGDDLNAWLWPQIFPGLERGEDDRRLIGIGSILDARYSTLAGTKIVFGSGARSPRTAPKLDGAWDVRFVRGPLTAAALELDHSVAITDGAVALAGLRLPRNRATGDVGFMPHCRTVGIANWEEICERAGVRFIDPTQPAPDVIEAIGSVDRLIAEALHGAIVADLFRVPWVRVRCHGTHYEGRETSEFKWVDWGRSLGVDVTAEDFPMLPLRPRSLLKRVVFHPVQSLRQFEIRPALRRLSRSPRFHLSRSATLNRAIERVGACVEQLRSELAAT